MIQDLRHALRLLRRSPGFAAIAILALALGIGANTAVFSIVHSMLYADPPFPQGNELVVFWDNLPEQGRQFNEVSPFNVGALEDADAFDIAAWDYAGWTLHGEAAPEPIAGQVVEPSLWPLLGVEPSLGRPFRPEEALPGAPAVAVLSHGLWQRRFGGHPGVLGSVVRLDDEPVTIVGVMPRGYFFGSAAELWRPLVLSEDEWQDRRRHWLRVVGRLREGATIDAARAEVDVIDARLAADHPETHAGWQTSVHPMTEGMAQGPVRPAMAVLLGAVALVLLIACANVANLLLAKGTRRRRELAIRAALGAGRARVARQLLTESFVLAALGALAGVLLAVWGLSGLERIIPPFVLENSPSRGGPGLNATVLTGTVIVSIVTAVLIGLAPMLRAARLQIVAALKEAHGIRTGEGRRPRLRGVLVAAELALALVLTTGAALLAKSFAKQASANPGYHAESVLTGTLRLGGPRYETETARTTFHDAVVSRIAGMAGVAAVATTNAIPLSGESPRADLAVEGQPIDPDRPLPSANLRRVSAPYFDVLGVPLVEGRAFTDADRGGSRPVAVVSRSAMREIFGGTALGRRFRIAGDTIAREVVGIVEDVGDWRLGQASQAFVYLPAAQSPPGFVGLLVRTRTAPASLGDELRREVAALDPNLAVGDLRPFADVVEEALFANRLMATMVGVLAFVALALAAVGVYGVMAFAVGQRGYEMSVRLALGARPRGIVWLLVRQGMLPILAGLALGLAGALAIAGGLRAVLWQVEARDPVAIAGTTALLVVSAFAATLIPAMRAARADPAQALKQ